jgi:hypothetical protein
LFTSSVSTFVTPLPDINAVESTRQSLSSRDVVLIAVVGSLVRANNKAEIKETTL